MGSKGSREGKEQEARSPFAESSQAMPLAPQMPWRLNGPSRRPVMISPHLFRGHPSGPS